MNVLREAEYRSVLAQLRDPQQRSWILLNPTSIGDTALVCAFARAFTRQHGHGITMVVPPDHMAVTKMYPNRFLRVLTADRNIQTHIINNYLDMDRFEIDVPICAHPYDHGDGRSDNLMYLFKYPGRGGLSLTDVFRHMLRLPWDAAIDRPQIPAEWDVEAEQIAQQLGMVKGKSVIIFPSNSSQHPQFPDVFWSTMAARLRERGYMVFTNMKGGNFHPKTMPIAGTTPINVDMHQALSLVRYAGRTISGAHGMQFLQLMGGQYAQMTVTMPIAKAFTDLQLNGRQYHSTAFMAQYMYPELLVNTPFAEFNVPFDGTEDELKRIAVAIADESFNDPSRVNRVERDGSSFLDAHRDWLQTLVGPISASLS